MMKMVLAGLFFSLCLNNIATAKNVKPNMAKRAPATEAHCAETAKEVAKSVLLLSNGVTPGEARILENKVTEKPGTKIPNIEEYFIRIGDLSYGYYISVEYAEPQESCAVKALLVKEVMADNKKSYF